MFYLHFIFTVSQMNTLNIALTPLTWPCSASLNSFQWFSPEILHMYWTSLYLAVPPDGAWADMAPMFPRPLKCLLSLNVSLAHMHLRHFWRNQPPCPHYYLIKSCHIHSAECTAETRHTSTSVAAIAYTVVGTRTSKNKCLYDEELNWREYPHTKAC